MHFLLIKNGENLQLDEPNRSFCSGLAGFLQSFLGERTIYIHHIHTYFIHSHTHKQAISFVVMME